VKVTDKVYALDATSQAHVYAVSTDDGVVLVDTSMPGKAPAIIAELRAHGLDHVVAILLTHHDVDHAGSAAKLQEAFGCPVYISATDLPYVKGEKSREGIKKVIGALMRVQVPADLRALPDGSIMGIQVLPTPGHTPGHTCYKFGGVLFAGDLLATQGGRLVASRPLMTWNMPQVLASLAAVKSADIAWVCPGHGSPLQISSATAWPGE